MEGDLSDIHIIFDARKQKPEGPANVDQITDDIGMAVCCRVQMCAPFGISQIAAFMFDSFANLHLVQYSH